MITIIVKIYFLLNIYQQAYYDYPLYLKWMWKHFIRNNFLVLAVLAAWYVDNLLSYIIVLMISIFYFVHYYRREKKHLVLTKRIMRLSIMCLLLVLLLYLVLPSFVILLLLDYIVLFADLLLSPLEKVIANHYINRAKKKVDAAHCTGIAITGSFGKTSVKNFCYEVLKEKYLVKMTPKSFNTPLGIARFVNDETFDLVDFVIYEFGARHVRDIADLRSKYRYDIAIITEIGIMHLDTFCSLDNIFKTKMDLLNGLKENGLAILNYENELIRNFVTQHQVISYGFNFGLYQAKNIHLGLTSSTFDLYVDGQFKSHITTSLVGRHMILNLLPSIILGDIYQIPYDYIGRITSVENRLKYRKVGDFHLLMDAYNSNLIGAKNALEVVKSHGGSRYIITPGFVESKLVNHEMAIDYALAINECVDFAYLIKNDFTFELKKYINISCMMFKDLDEAYRCFKSNHLSNSIMLIENDCLDIY